MRLFLSTIALSNLKAKNEIEASQHRLTLAKKYVARTTSLLESRKSEYNAFQNEIGIGRARRSRVTADIQDTEAFLKEVEKKWEVVDVDDDESVIEQARKMRLIC